MNTLVVYGGKSCEHDISIITACLAKGYFAGKVISAYLDGNNVCYLVPNSLTPGRHVDVRFKKQIAFLCGRKQIAVFRGKHMRICDVDLVVNCCHGKCGEDGTVAALAAICNLPMVGSDVISSGVAMDKIFSKYAFAAIKIPSLPYVGLTKNQPSVVLQKLDFPVIVKPATLGSSIGISLCNNAAELQKGLDLAFSHDKRVLCEKALTNFYEVNCSAMRVSGKTTTSAVERPVSTGEILSFSDKYLRGGKWEPQKQAVPEKVAAKARRLTEKIYENFSLNGVVRVDFLVDNETGKIFANEINAIPGSLAYGLWQNVYTPKQFGMVLSQQAMNDFDAQNKLVHRFDSGVLTQHAISKK